LAGPQIWQDRATAAEEAVWGRHARRLLGLPGTALGVVGWPFDPGHRLFLTWHLWWQAHLLDCAVDAWMRSPGEVRTRRVAGLARAIRLRNLGRYTNDYYDDMAWIGLALQRAVPLGVDPQSVRAPVTAILDAWNPPVGGIPWRRGDEFYNSPANAPAAILLARSGFTRRARQMADWIDRHLRTPGSDLIADGFHPGEDLEPVFYTYNQGAVLIGHGGGDGGLFTGILARYLALVSTRLPGADRADRRARSTAGALVTGSAAAAWEHRVDAQHGPLFGADWTRPAQQPERTGPGASSRPERDLSVQLSGWMLLEAAALLERAD